MRCPSDGNGGFSLLELLIAVSIFSLLGAGLATAFSAGIQVKRRVQRLELQSAGVVPVLADIQQNLRNLIISAKTPLAGNENSLTFSVRVSGRDEEGLKKTSTLLLSYGQDEVTGDLVKQTKDRQGLNPQTSTLMSGEFGLKFFFLSSSSDDDGLHWLSEWEMVEPPPVVKVVIEFPPLVENGEPAVWQRTVRLPVAQMIEGG